jgi:hypothetical protein
MTMRSIFRCMVGVKFEPEPAGDHVTGGRATASADGTPSSVHTSTNRSPRRTTA